MFGSLINFRAAWSSKGGGRATGSDLGAPALVGKETTDQTLPPPASLGLSLAGEAGCFVHLAPAPRSPLELWSESGDCSSSNCLLNSLASLYFLADFLSLSPPSFSFFPSLPSSSFHMLRSSPMTALVSSRCSLKVDCVCVGGELFWPHACRVFSSLSRWVETPAFFYKVIWCWTVFLSLQPSLVTSEFSQGGACCGQGYSLASISLASWRTKSGPAKVQGMPGLTLWPVPKEPGC